MATTKSGGHSALDESGVPTFVAVLPRSEPLPRSTASEIGVPLVVHTSGLHAIATRALDLVIGISLFIVTLPVAVLVALIVRYDSPGPAVFRQQRVGRGGQPFTFYKFRTMHVDATQQHPDLYAYRYAPDEIGSMYFKFADDPRLTRFGRLLRRTSIDELPNLVNVVRGDMSLVGPRPEIPEMVPYYLPEQMAKFEVKPGVTGLAQVSGRNILRFQETVRKDVEYVSKRSIRYDLSILARTPLVVLKMFGAL